MKGTIQDWEDDRAKTEIIADIAALEALEVTTTFAEGILPGTVPPVTVDPITLLERQTAGWRTELRLLADGDIAIWTQQGFDGPIYGSVIPKDKALDAFEHPYCYIAKA